MSESRPPSEPNDEGTSILPPLGRAAEADRPPAPAPASAAGPADVAVEVRCPSCGQPLEDDSRFCQACGTQLGETAATAPDADDPPRPWFPLVLVGWILVMVLALVFLFSTAIQVGST